MTTHQFPLSNGNIIFIGTAGGMTKGSSGYTFQFIQKNSDAIVELLEKGIKPVVKPSWIKKRFRFYDNVLLHVLSNDLLTGKEIFSRLFKKVDTEHLFRFLDNDSKIFNELRVISALPSKIFLKAAINQLFKK